MRHMSKQKLDVDADDNS